MENAGDFLIKVGVFAAIASIFGIVLKAYLDRESTLESRKYALREKKIAEAKELLSIYNQVIREVLTIRTSFNTAIPLVENNLSTSIIDETKANFTRIEELLNISPERLKSISGLGDETLKKLHEVFRKDMYAERGKLNTLKTRLNRKETINIKEDFLEIAILANRLSSAISTMYDRIDKIALTEP